jgi:hypothetical protein
MFDFNAWFSALSYVWQGTLWRALRSGVAVVVATLLAALTAGTLLPATVSPVVIIVVTILLQTVDKYLRESSIAKAAAAQTMVTDTAIGPGPSIDFTADPTVKVGTDPVQEVSAAPPVAVPDQTD